MIFFNRKGLDVQDNSCSLNFISLPNSPSLFNPLVVFGAILSLYLSFRCIGGWMRSYKMMLDFSRQPCFPLTRTCFSTAVQSSPMSWSPCFTNIPRLTLSLRSLILWRLLQHAPFTAYPPGPILVSFLGRSFELNSDEIPTVSSLHIYIETCGSSDDSLVNSI